MSIVIFLSLTLLIAQNATSIALFAFVVFLMEYGGHSFLHGAISKRMVLLPLSIITGLVLVGWLLLILPESVGVDFFKILWRQIGRQVDVVIGSDQNLGYFEGLIYTFISYPDDVIKLFPLGVLIGDGFSTFGHHKGGDFGIVESLHRFGMPLFFAILIGLMSLIRHALKQMYYKMPNQSSGRSYLWFAVSATLYIVLADIHYSIWPMKSILPIMFINLAIFDRYLYSTAQRRQQR
mgnify:CR=1 FL=1